MNPGPCNTESALAILAFLLLFLLLIVFFPRKGNAILLSISLNSVCSTSLTCVHNPLGSIYVLLTIEMSFFMPSLKSVFLNIFYLGSVESQDTGLSIRQLNTVG